MGARLEVTDTPAVFRSAASEASFCVVDGGCPENGATFQATYARLPKQLGPRAVLIADLPDNAAFLPLIERDLCHHVIAASHPRMLFSLSTTVAKLTRGRATGIEIYVPWGVRVQGFEIRGSEHKQKVIDQMSDYLDLMGVHQRLASLARTVADEFLMNAVYDAAVNEDGTPIFNDVPRSEVVTIPAPHRAEFRYCCTGDSIVLSVMDSFGSLAPDTIRANLQRTLAGGDDQIRSGSSAGAGVGLYMSFSALAEWITNITPGKRTEMVGVLRANGTYRAHAAAAKSFHLFVGE